MLARQGAQVVVNDVGSSTEGAGTDATLAGEVVDAIRAAGGQAVVQGSDVASWDGAKALVDDAIAAFGRLDILVNNAGIVRDQPLTEMGEAQWDEVIRVHLKGTFAPTRHAAAYWRRQHEAGRAVDARIINTTSHRGLFPPAGQANYGAAKGGIASFTLVAARELQFYGVTVNAVAPRAYTRMSRSLRNAPPALLEERDPESVAALVAWLASPEAAGVSGRIFEASGAGYAIAESWQHGPVTAAARDPAGLGAGIAQIIRQARRNAGIERDAWLDP